MNPAAFKEHWTLANGYYTYGQYPRGPFYLDGWTGKKLLTQPELWGSLPVVYRYWPILTPDNGIIFCSTEDDAMRVCITFNELLDRIADLERELDGSKTAYRFRIPFLRGGHMGTKGRP